mmetsp:Transcript_33865/g.56849  ORF Transcript_33865/g.56849 Transcript_33865/m.56849 type:complete len:290 (-) Transcript_33865:335-1204(-)
MGALATLPAGGDTMTAGMGCGACPGPRREAAVSNTGSRSCCTMRCRACSRRTLVFFGTFCTTFCCCCCCCCWWVCCCCWYCCCSCCGTFCAFSALASALAGTFCAFFAELMLVLMRAACRRMRAATMAAPNPLSMFTTDTPGEQALREESSGASPRKKSVPVLPTLVGMDTTGHSTTPATMLDRAPSIPAATSTTSALRIKCSWSSMRCKPPPMSGSSCTLHPITFNETTASSATGRSAVTAASTTTEPGSRYSWLHPHSLSPRVVPPAVQMRARGWYLVCGTCFRRTS